MATTARRVSIWIWPVVAIVLVAVAGQVFGLLGSIIAASCAAAALLFTAAELFRARRARRDAALLSIGCVLVVLAVFTLQGAVPWSRAVAAGGGLVDARGERPTPDDLRVPTLRGALLDGADLTGLDLGGRDLAGAEAAGAAFRDADLAGASLRGADLRGSDLTGACLDGADLTGADLTGAKVTGATVTLPAGAVVSGSPLPVGERATSCG
jgi:hypothetical protein